MKLIYKTTILCLLIMIVNSLNLKTSTAAKTKTLTLSKEQIEELEKLEKEKLAKLEEEKAKLEAEERRKPNIDQVEHMTDEEREELTKNAKAEEETKEEIKNVPILNISGDLIWKGWVKYFHYKSDVEVTKPNHFYENPSFFTEIVKYEHKNDKTQDENYKYIQDKYHFWCKLLPSGNLNIIGERKNEHNTLAETVENLNTDLIGYVHPDNNASGAIRDLGSFNEGHCISVATKVPDNIKDLKYNPRTQNGQEEKWIICTEKESEKNKLMSALISLKIERQKEIEDFGLTEKTKNLSVAELMQVKPFQPKMEKYTGRGSSGDDGYWILLQDWSECSLKCGGGNKIQQWLCVPPKNHGKPCIGDSIRRKPCNETPCPSSNPQALIQEDDKTHITLKPIYKALPYSKRPQQFIKCQIKENDVLYKTKEYDPEKKKIAKVPGRIVMNTKSISIYKDDGYNNLLFSFNLDTTVFNKSESDFCCFMLSNANRQYEMCGFNNNCGTVENPIWVAKWGFDFEYFQRKCYEELHEVPINPGSEDENKNLPPAARSQGIPLSAHQKEIVDGRRAVITKKIEDNVQKRMDEKVGTTQKVALTAIRREINLEDLIKNEEIQKGKDETQELYQQMQQEKKKKELLEKALVTRDSNFGKMRIAKDTERKIDSIKHDAKVDIKFKRGVLKKKLEEIRSKFRRKHRQIKQQIEMIRAEMAKDIVTANKKGNQELCKEGRNSLEKITSYCNKNYSSDYAKNVSCKDPQNFCYSCCETEFGNLFIAQRDDCTNMCDDLEKQDLDNGDWVWNGGMKNESKEEEPLKPPETEQNDNIKRR